MSYQYKSRTLKNFYLQEKTQLSLDLFKQNRYTFAVITNLYQSTYKYPISLSLYQNSNATINRGFGLGNILNYDYRLLRVQANELSLCNPMLEFESFTFVESKNDIDFDNNHLSYRYYYSDLSTNYVIETKENETTTKYVLYTNEFEAEYGITETGLITFVQKIIVKHGSNKYSLFFTYNSSNRVLEIYNDLPEKEIARFTYENDKCRYIEIFKLETPTNPTETKISKVSFYYLNDKINQITESYNTQPTYQVNTIFFDNTSENSRIIGIRDDVRFLISYIYLEQDINGYFITKIEDNLETTTIAYDNNYQTTVKTMNTVTNEEDIIVKNCLKYHFSQNGNLMFINDNDVMMQAFNYNDKHQLISVSKPLYIKTSLNGNESIGYVITQDANDSFDNVVDNTCPANNNPTQTIHCIGHELTQYPKIKYTYDISGGRHDCISVILWYRITANYPTSMCEVNSYLTLLDQENNEVSALISNNINFNMENSEWTAVVLSTQAATKFTKVVLNLVPSGYPIDFEVNATLYKDNLNNIYQYDERNNKVKALVGKRITYNSYSEDDNLIINQKKVCSYDENGNPFFQISANKTTYEFEYDEYNNITKQLIKTFDNKKMMSENTYTSSEHLISQTDFNNKTSTYNYETNDKKLTKKPLLIKVLNMITLMKQMLKPDF